MYKVIDVAKLFSVSKVTIYKKISANKEALKGHITKKKNVTYLDDDAVEIIKNSLQVNQERASGRLIDEELKQVYDDLKLLQDQNDRIRAEKISMLNDQLVDLESAVRHLNSQVLVKENHLKTKSEVLENFSELLRTTKMSIKSFEEIITHFDVN